MSILRFFKHTMTRQEVWDKANLKAVSSKLPIAKAAEFDRICAAFGLTRYEAIRRFCVTVLRKPAMLGTLER